MQHMLQDIICITYCLGLIDLKKNNKKTFKKGHSTKQLRLLKNGSSWGTFILNNEKFKDSLP